MRRWCGPGMHALTATAAQRLRWPVVSVGNLSVGGAGKTPLVICLARLLQREGFVDVLSRGYGRSRQDSRARRCRGECGAIWR